MNSIKIKSILSIIFSLVLVIAIAITTQTEEVKASDDVCTTFSTISKDCLSLPTNCLCEIIIDG